VGNIPVKRKVEFDLKEGYRKADDITGAKEEELVVEYIRDYKLGGALGHVTGYVGEVNEEEVGKVKGECVDKGPRKMHSFIGRSGLEEYYNCKLFGIDGEEMVEVDSSGKKIRTLGRREPVAGEDLITTIDFGLQKKVAELMIDKKGAVVVTDTKGEVLALLSSPSYDPNVFVRKESALIDALLKDENLPLFNRVISGSFHPGSVFKPVVSLAALTAGVIDENYTYEDIGYIKVGDFLYRNWYYTQYGGSEGAITLKKAIARSTDTFFYKIGELSGIDKIVETSEKFGLNVKTKIDLTGEIAGLVPSPDWKQKVKGERWYLGNTYHVSIGQGDLSLTPIEVNSAIAAIASRGRLCSPSISKEPECRELDIEKKHLELVIGGMKAACSAGGTGYTFFNFEEKSGGLVPIACKTGTAETGVGDDTHAWFVSFAPVEDPEIVATVLVEKGGEGSKEAGPIARELYNYWFDIKEETAATPSATIFVSPTPSGN